MQIDRNNYEEWLLRYLDGELSQAECAAVEAFAAQHADINEELQQLKATLLAPEAPAPMPNKHMLYRATLWDAEQLSTLQEKMLLLADDALPLAEKEALLATIAAEPALQKDWALLQQARLLPEAAEAMPGKASLYRPSRGATLFTIRRTLQWAAAAMVAGMGLWAAWQFNPGQAPAATMVSRSNQLPASVSSGEQPRQEAPTNAGTATAAITKDAGTKGTGTIGTSTMGASTTAEESVATVALSGAAQRTSVPAAQAAPASRNISIQAVNASTGHLPAQEQPAIAATYSPVGPESSTPARQATERAAIMPISSVPESLTGAAATLPAGAATAMTIQMPVANPASATEEAINSLPDAGALASNNLQEQDEDNTVSIAGLRIPRQKLRGAYRTITRPIGRLFDKPAEGEVAAR